MTEAMLIKGDVNNYELITREDLIFSGLIKGDVNNYELITREDLIFSGLNNVITKTKEYYISSRVSNLDPVSSYLDYVIQELPIYSKETKIIEYEITEHAFVPILRLKIEQQQYFVEFDKQVAKLGELVFFEEFGYCLFLNVSSVSGSLHTFLEYGIPVDTDSYTLINSNWHSPVWTTNERPFLVVGDKNEDE